MFFLLNIEVHIIINLKKSIKKLNTKSINIISAGEVIERPSAAVKELLENSLDADSSTIDISYSEGGKKLIKIVDDGWGIPCNELALAVESHSTSKFFENLSEIKTFGFRGEALSSISSVSNMTIKSKNHDADDAFQIQIHAGKVGNIKPSNIQKGTSIEIENLFFSTPARLKFLKKTTFETRNIIDVVKRAALGSPEVQFILRDITISGKEKIIFHAPVERNKSQIVERIRRILGTEFLENSLEINHNFKGYNLKGYISLPTYSKPSTLNQYFFINGRIIKDKMISALAKNGYNDFLSSNKFPVVIFFIECDPSLVDINVHPAKLEVRFSSSDEIRHLIISGIKNSLLKNGLKPNTNLSNRMYKSFTKSYPNFNITNNENDYDSLFKNKKERSNLLDDFDVKDINWNSGAVEKFDENSNKKNKIFDLGIARAQIYKNYILSQTENSLLVIDQHAAHERLLYEKMKKSYYGEKVKSQSLLLPEIIELNNSDKEIILENASKLKKCGLDIEDFGENAICVRSVPAILGEVNVKLLIDDILKELGSFETIKELDKKIDQVLSRISCHGSIRSGRVLNADEMNNLLREMEKTPASAQCNHGRPTFIELKLLDIEKLFGRR